jgi:hypothetical protein
MKSANPVQAMITPLTPSHLFPTIPSLHGDFYPSKKNKHEQIDGQLPHSRVLRHVCPMEKIKAQGRIKGDGCQREKKDGESGCA